MILDKINGQISFGALTALMGPSGAGKTTLLRCINGFNQSDISNDSMFYCGKVKDQTPLTYFVPHAPPIFSSLSCT